MNREKAVVGREGYCKGVSTPLKHSRSTLLVPYAGLRVTRRPDGDLRYNPNH
jgi:hypothetical protein